MSYFDKSCIAIDTSVVGPPSYAVVVFGKLLPARFATRNEAGAHLSEMQVITAKVTRAMSAATAPRKAKAAAA